LLTLTGLVEPDGRVLGYGQGGGAGEVQRVEVDVGHAAVEADRFVGDRERQRHRDIGGDHAELAGGDRDAGLAAAVDGVDRRGFRGGPDGDPEVDITQVAGRPGEWIAEEVAEHGGEAMLWLGQPAEITARAGLIDKMTVTVAADYLAVAAEAVETLDADPATRRRVAARLRRELHRINARDFFPPPQRDTAARAVGQLATHR